MKIESMNGWGVKVWAVTVLFSVGFLLWKISAGLPIETNILAMLPEKSDATESVWRQQAKDKLSQKFKDDIVVVLSHAEKTKLIEATSFFLHQMKEGEFVEIENLELKSDLIQEIGNKLYPYRSGLLSPQDRRYLLDGDVNSVAQAALAQITSPFSFVDSSSLRDDPLLFFPRYLGSLGTSKTSGEFIEGFPTINSNLKTHVVMNLKLKESSFSQEFQERFVPFFEQVSLGMHYKDSALKISKVGAVFYAEKATEQAKEEASLIGGVSLFAILLMIYVTFRSLQPAFLSMLAISTGLIFATTISLAVFGKLYLITLVFGAAIIGISVDYALHYCCERFSPDYEKLTSRVNGISRGMSLSALSSIVGFLVIMWPPFPGLRQIGLFSAAGLLMSCLTVLFIFPHLDRSKTRQMSGLLYSLSNKLLTIWQRGVTKKSQLVVATLLAFITVVSAMNFVADDDVRRLQPLNTSFKSEEDFIRGLSGISEDAQFFIVTGENEEQILQNEEKLRDSLDLLVSENVISDYLAVSKFVPSKKRQMENRQFVTEAYRKSRSDEMVPMVDGAGYDQGSHRPLSLTKSLELGLLSAIEFLLMSSDESESAHLITLMNVKNLEKLQSLGRDSPFVEFVDPATDVSQTLEGFRSKVISLLGVSFLVVGGVLSMRYGVSGSIRTILPPLLCVILTPLIISLMGGIFTFFNAMALILVFALGLDYALFCAESSFKHLPVSMLANLLSALSSIFAFGLLAFSSQYAVHAFGVTIMVGVTLAFILAPFARQPDKNLPKKGVRID